MPAGRWRCGPESGAPYYKARKIGDLNGVTIRSLTIWERSTSLGYKPTNEKRERLVARSCGNKFLSVLT